MNPYLFYLLVFGGFLCAGLLCYEIFVLFRQTGGPRIETKPQLDLSGIRSD